jgi:hypothetical protein
MNIQLEQYPNITFVTKVPQQFNEYQLLILDCMVKYLPPKNCYVGFSDCGVFSEFCEMFITYNEPRVLCGFVKFLLSIEDKYKIDLFVQANNANKPNKKFKFLPANVIVYSFCDLPF